MVILRALLRLEVDDLQDVPDRPLVERGDLPLGDEVPAAEELEVRPVLEQDVERQLVRPGVLGPDDLGGAEDAALHFDSFPPRNTTVRAGKSSGRATGIR